MMMLLNIPHVCVSYNLLSKYAHGTQGQIHEKYTERPYITYYICVQCPNWSQDAPFMT